MAHRYVLPGCMNQPYVDVKQHWRPFRWCEICRQCTHPLQFTFPRARMSSRMVINIQHLKSNHHMRWIIRHFKSSQSMQSLASCTKEIGDRIYHLLIKRRVLAAKLLLSVPNVRRFLMEFILIDANHIDVILTFFVQECCQDCGGLSSIWNLVIVCN